MAADEPRCGPQEQRLRVRRRVGLHVDLGEVRDRLAGRHVEDERRAVGLRRQAHVVGGRQPSADTPPGNAITIGAAGEKPSARFHAVGSIEMLSMFVGSVPCGIASRRPVIVVASSTSNTDDGHGAMQFAKPSGLQLAFIGNAVSLLQAASRATR